MSFKIKANFFVCLTVQSRVMQIAIWKRYVDDTCTILDRENVGDFLQHLNNQQPCIRFTIKADNDNKLAFLDSEVLRESDSRLAISEYRKPTHIDQYLAYDSRHPQSVKRSIVKCLYERAQRLVTKPSVISKEKKHLHLFWFLMVVLFLSFRNLPRPENQTTVPNTKEFQATAEQQSFTRVLPEFYLCPNSFAVPYNNNSQALFSSRKLR